MLFPCALISSQEPSAALSKKYLQEIQEYRLLSACMHNPNDALQAQEHKKIMIVELLAKIVHRYDICTSESNSTTQEKQTALVEFMTIYEKINPLNKTTIPFEAFILNSFLKQAPLSYIDWEKCPVSAALLKQNKPQNEIRRPLIQTAMNHQYSKVDETLFYQKNMLLGKRKMTKLATSALSKKPKKS